MEINEIMLVNAEYLYGLYQCNEANDLPDLTIALAHLQASCPIPDGMTEQQITRFLGRHYDALVEAYRTGHTDGFRAAVAACDRDDSTNEVEA